MSSKYDPILRERDFQNVQNILQEILQKKDNLNEFEANNLSDKILKENDKQIKKLFDEEYYKNTSPYDIANLIFDKFYKTTKLNQIESDLPVDNELQGERDLNVMENIIIKFNTFEKKIYGK